jgi:hypothetical protein
VEETAPSSINRVLIQAVGGDRDSTSPSVEVKFFSDFPFIELIDPATGLELSPDSAIDGRSGSHLIETDPPHKGGSHAGDFDSSSNKPHYLSIGKSGLRKIAGPCQLQC